MTLVTDKNNCCGCGGCVNVCSKDAVSLQEDEYGFLYPQIDSSRCVECGLCRSVCEKVNKNESDMPLQAFAAAHRNKNTLRESSSGGVFAALAEHFLSIGGAVCGCVFDDSLNAVHICTESKDDLIKIQKSKYLQSNVGLVYRDVKKRLQQGQQVLFTGTPCQIAALYAVVGRKFDNLTTMDLICHGVPSQRLFHQFIAYLEKRHRTKIVSFDFRSKKYGWPRFTMEFTDSRGRSVNLGKGQEFYIPAFTGGNTIRPNCLSCKYACANRIGDITIGDLWGYEKCKISFNTLGGTSVFTVNTPRGKQCLEILSGKLYCEEIDYAVAVKGNTCLHHPTPQGKKRSLYLEAIKNDKIDALADNFRLHHRGSILKEKLKLMLPASAFNFIRKAKNKPTKKRS